jgi:hypothetical protein
MATNGSSVGPREHATLCSAGHHVPIQWHSVFITTIAKITKSYIESTKTLTYLGLNIDLLAHTTVPTEQCLQHLSHLLQLVLQASMQCLWHRVEYMSWLCWAMDWHHFIAAPILQRVIHWIHFFKQYHLLIRSRKLQLTQAGSVVYTNNLHSSVPATTNSNALLQHNTPPSPSLRWLQPLYRTYRWLRTDNSQKQ